MNEQDLKRTLQSLSLAKHKILLKSTKTREIEEDCTFRFNSAFTSPLSKIKLLQISSTSSSSSHSNAIGSNQEGGGVPSTTMIGMVSSTGNMMETDLEAKETMSRIEEERKYTIEAAIVRVMKSRKKMNHSALVSEVIKVLNSRFTPSMDMVKRRIEGLMEREYLARDSKDR